MADILSQEEIDALLDYTSDTRDDVDIGIRKYYDKRFEITEDYAKSNITRQIKLSELDNKSLTTIDRLYKQLANKLMNGEVHPKHFLKASRDILELTRYVLLNYSDNKWVNTEDEDLDQERCKEIAKDVASLLSKLYEL